MSTFAYDSVPPPRPVVAGRRTSVGLGFAVASALSFGLSGALATGLFDNGWTPGSVVLIRVAIGAAVVLPLGLRALGGRYDLLGANAALILAYGALAVAGAQFCYFSAVARMDVGPALLIEYTAPAAVVVWLWLRHGERPGKLTVVGALLAAVGLVLVLDLASGADLDPVGIAWALAAMVGCAVYFVINAREGTGLPPVTLAAAGLVVGALGLGLLGLTGLMPLSASTGSVSYRDAEVSWLLPVLLLGVVTAGLAYATGVAAGRRLGSRLASFVALLEVLAGVTFAWLLLAQLPGWIQLLGGILVLAGVIAVKLGEGSTAPRDAEPVASLTR